MKGEKNTIKSQSNQILFIKQIFELTPDLTESHANIKKKTLPIVVLT